MIVESTPSPSVPRARLGRYVEWSPQAALANAVEACWIFDARDSGGGRTGASRNSLPDVDSEPGIHRVLPHTGTSVVVTVRPDRGRFDDSDVRLFGPLTTTRIFRPRSGTILLAVRLRAEWTRGALGVDPADLRDRIVSWGSRRGRRALDRVRQATSLHECGTVLEEIVGQATAEAASTRLRHLSRGLDNLRRGRPVPAPVAGLAEALGISERHLRRSVRELTGLSPKLLQRIERLSAAVVAADAHPSPPWSRIAFRHGFSDQAHLVREAVALAGLTPTRLHQERARQDVGGMGSTHVTQDTSRVDQDPGGSGSESIQA